MKQSNFLKMVLPFKDKVFRLAKRMLISTEEAEDATQECYYKLWQNRSKLRQYKNIESFAVSITKNYCFDRLKSGQAHNLSLTHSNYEQEDNPLFKKIEDEDTVNQIHKIIQQLPRKQQLIVQLRDIEQYDFQQISDVLQINPAAVRTGLSRARKTIREVLLKQNNYGT